jgi:nitronate monooxygenase
VGGLIQRIGMEVPIVQAGMGGGLSTHRLAAAVTSAGGLGTIGILPATISARRSPQPAA